MAAAADLSSTETIMQNMQNNGSWLKQTTFPSLVSSSPLQKGNNITSHTILHLHQFTIPNTIFNENFNFMQMKRMFKACWLHIMYIGHFPHLSLRNFVFQKYIYTFG